MADDMEMSVYGNFHSQRLNGYELPESAPDNNFAIPTARPASMWSQATYGLPLRGSEFMVQESSVVETENDGESEVQTERIGTSPAVVEAPSSAGQETVPDSQVRGYNGTVHGIYGIHWMTIAVFCLAGLIVVAVTASVTAVEIIGLQGQETHKLESWCHKLAAQGRCYTCHDYWTDDWTSANKVYPICLTDTDGSHLLANAYCHMTAGGFTYMFQILDNSTNFNRSWADYEAGFGAIGRSTSYWLGLRAMHLLTSRCGQTQGRIEVGSTCGADGPLGERSAYADFNSFKVGDSAGHYRLNLSDPVPHGSAGFGDYHRMDGQPFSAFDADHDQWPDFNCAAGCASGWWYNNCFSSKLTGRWYSDCSRHHGTGIRWSGWPDDYDAYSVQRAAIKVRAPQARPKLSP